MWQHYLLGKNFLLLTNHRSFTNFFNQSNLNARQARWTTFPGEYGFDLKHIMGKENRVADSLSRKLHCIYEVHFSHAQSNLPRVIREASLEDLEYAFLWQHALESQVRGKQCEYAINYDNMSTFRNRIYIPNHISVKQMLLDEFHRKSYAAHPGY